MASFFDLSLKRTKGQVFGFYIVYAILGILLAGLFNAVVSVANNPGGVGGSFQDGYAAGKATARATLVPLYTVAIFNLIIALIIIYSKKIYASIPALILLVVTGCLSFACGALLGTIPLAALTTFEINDNA